MYARGKQVASEMCGSLLLSAVELQPDSRAGSFGGDRACCYDAMDLTSKRRNRRTLNLVECNKAKVRPEDRSGRK